MKNLIVAMALAGLLLSAAACEFRIPDEDEKMASFALIHGGAHGEFRFADLDFSPNGTSDFDVVCTGQPLRYSDVKLYTPQIGLNQPAPRDFTLYFWVKSDRTARGDPTLGYFSVEIPAGSSGITSMLTPIAGAAGRRPIGAPDSETQGFWLGCTGGCKVRGNEGRNNDKDARVYLELFELNETGGIRFAGDTKSPRREVECD